MKRVIIGINTDFNEECYQILAAYVNSIVAAGGLPLLVPCHDSREVLDKYVGMVKGFVFIGGRDYPSHYYGAKPHGHEKLVDKRRAETDLYLAKAVLRRRLPVLGICGGHQLINIALGGKLVQHVSNASCHGGGRMHPIEIKDGRILRRLFGRKKIMVNSFHHQAVARDGVAAGLKAVAFDKAGLVEAFESVGLPFVLGLQWHPERMSWRGHASKIFGALVKAARIRYIGKNAN